jgi:nitroreductase
MDLNSFQSRFGLPLDAPDVPLSEYIESQLARSTVRDFTQEALVPGTLEVLLATAQSASTSGGLQTYSVLALTKQEDKEKLFSTKESRNAIGAIDSRNVKVIMSAPVFLIWIADLARVDFLLNKIHKTTPFDAEILRQTSRAEYHLKAIIDTTIAAQAFASAAESMKLGIMYCGAIRQIPVELFEKEFGFPKLTFPIFGMAVGHPAPLALGQRVKPRLQTKTILHNGKYEPTSFNEVLEYNKVYSDGKYNYTERLVERMAVSWTKTNVSNSLRNMGFNFD